jgi:metal-responsive CopG/Arc/MetJ family transcriptional regulator
MEANVKKKKNQIIIFLTDETLDALNKMSRSEEQTRSNMASQIIKKAVQKFRQNET